MSTAPRVDAPNRVVVFDTETTGLKAGTGPDADRVVDIGLVEIIDGVETGAVWQAYLNPERPMPDGAFKVHGLSRGFLSRFPTFGERAQEFLDFIGQSRLVIHNAGFDMKMINAELERAGRPALAMERTIDTLHTARSLARKGESCSLDNVAARYGIDKNSFGGRQFHGALIDCRMTAAVYLHMEMLKAEIAKTAGPEIEIETSVYVAPEPRIPEEQVAAIRAGLDRNQPVSRIAQEMEKGAVAASPARIPEAAPLLPMTTGRYAGRAIGRVVQPTPEETQAFHDVLKDIRQPAWAR